MKKFIFSIAGSLLLLNQASAEDTGPTFTSNPAVLNVHNRCIVSFHDDIDSNNVTGLAHALAARANASVQFVYQHSIKGFTVNVPCAAASAAFGGEAVIKSLIPDSIVTISKGKPPPKDGNTITPAAQEVSYGTGRVGGPVDGSGDTAWIIDTGIDLDHPDLDVDVSRGFSVILSKGLPSMNDENGHGTHVAGIIAALDNSIGTLGVAAGATVVPVRVLDRRGSGTVSGVIAGVDYVAANADPGDCVNMSLGGGVSSALDDAVFNASENSGAYFALAAGNEGDNANNHSPARTNGSHIWTISAIDVNDNMPYWSNYGNPPVDYAAPGVSIISLWKDGGTRTISGTSMAAPHACAVLMLSAGVPVADGQVNNDPDGTPDNIISVNLN